MKKIAITAVVSLSTLFFSFKAIPPGTWIVDHNHAKVGFSISHNMTSDVEGSFKSFDATITTSGEDLLDF